MSDYPATTLAKNRGKYYVLLTIPMELREHFSGRKQIKRSTGTNDLNIAKRKQHGITTEIYAMLDNCKPDPRDVISDLLGYIGEAEEVQRLENEGDLEGLIQYHKSLEYGEDPEDDLAVDVVNENGAKALKVYREWKASEDKGAAQSGSGSVSFSVASEQYLETKPYGPLKTMRDCELSLEQFQAFAGDILLDAVTPVLIHQYAKHVGETKSRETVSKKIGYVRRMYDHAVREGWLPSNAFIGFKLANNIGKQRRKYIPLTDGELRKLFSKDMPEHVRQLYSILVTTGMRLDEAALLDWEDVKVDAKEGFLYFDTTKGIVKNDGSRRQVPVHSKLEWLSAGKTGQMFPQFTRDQDGKAQASASKVLMRIMRKVTEEDMKAIHSLRGNFKDMLRDAGVSKEVNDFITGHASGDVAGNYGAGPSLAVRREAIEKLEFDFL